MSDRHHTGPWAHPPRKDSVKRAKRDQIAALIVIALALAVAIYIARTGERAIEQAAYDAVNYEVIR